MDWGLLVAGVMGGFAIEALSWYSRRETLRDGIPDYAKHLGYWLTTIVMVLLGGGLVLLYKFSGIDLKPIVAFNIGASAPSVIAAAAKASPPRITS